MITKDFIKTSFIYTVAGALPLASAVILLPFYVLYLPTEVYGALSLYMAFALFVQIVVIFSFDSSTYIHYHDFKHDPPTLASFISSTFVLMLITGAAVGLVLVLLGDLVFGLIFNDPRISFYPYGLMSVATGIVQSLFKVYTNILQSRQKPVLFFRSNVLQFILIAVFTLAGLYFFPGSLAGPVGGRMLAGIIVAGWALYRVFGEFGFHFNFQLLRSTFGYNVYAFIHQLEQWGINYLDRFLMLFYLPLSSIGLYDLAVKCLVALEFVQNGLHNSFYPKVVSAISAQTKKTSTPELNRYYHGMIAVMMVLITVSIFALPFVIELFGTRQGYQQAIQFIPYVAAVYVIRTMRFYFAAPFGILKYTKPLPIVSAIVFAFKVGLMILLIPRFEVYAVIIASIASGVLELFMLRYALRERFVFQFNIFKIVIAPIALMIIVLLFEPMFADNFDWQLHVFYIVVTVVFLLWAYRNELKLLNLSRMFGRR